ncbi:MAG: hypothetical protein RLZZ165_1622 [Bacteroidota bacterium]|jgi:hypothetical protein
MEPMNGVAVTADDLLAGADAAYRVEVPPEIVKPGGEPLGKPVAVVLRPITIGTFHLILKASKDDPAMVPLLLIKESMVEPPMSMQQVQRMHIGLVEFLVLHIRDISGMGEKKNI